MRTLMTIPSRRPQRIRPGGSRSFRGVRGVHDEHAFAPLLDAKAASKLLGIPPTWLLAQAREGRVPHHRLGHYVRFSAEDLRQWLTENRITPGPSRVTSGGRS
jgi:excisionase family DNA binding protein